MIRQLNIHNQVVIPKEYIEALRISENDYLAIRLDKRSGEIKMKPVSLESQYSPSEIQKIKKLFTKKHKNMKPMSAKEFLEYLR